VSTLRVPYESPPWSFDPWTADRPADLAAGQPRAPHYGNQGPDQGFVLKLARNFEDTLVLSEREAHDDAVAGCQGVALKRASLFGRAPVIYDLTVAFTVWGYLHEAPADLVDIRRSLFEQAANPHHYAERRRITDLVPEATLRLLPAEAEAHHRADWGALLDLSLLDTRH
jgi:hypothetical protein